MSKEDTISTSTDLASLSAADVRARVQAHLDGRASADDVALLTAHPDEWGWALLRLLDDADAALERVRVQVTGPERGLVLEDFAAERARIVDAYTALTGRAPGAAAQPPAQPEPDTQPPGVVQLQLSWVRGSVVAWAAGHHAEAEVADEVQERLVAAGAGGGAWTAHPPIALPDGGKAEALVAPTRSTLGWLVALGTLDDDDTLAELGVSTRWLGLVAAMAVRLAAQGRMVPQLEKAPSPPRSGGRALFGVRWVPALIDPDELAALARAMPAAAAVLDGKQNPRLLIEHIIGDVLDAICHDAAARIEVPAPPPDPRSDAEVAETVLARLDGTPFDAPLKRGMDVAQGLARWAKAVTGAPGLRLVVRLDPPDESGAWHLRTLAPTGKGKIAPVDAAMSNAPTARREAIKRELDRLELLYPALLRSRGTRRGEVLLGQDEAWQLMTEGGAVLVDAGFDVRVPPLTRRKAKAGLLLTSTESHASVVGSQQLTTVRWSAVFDDVELSAADIMRLASQARPLVKAQGRWVELDRADLEAAAAALAERADRTQLTGAEMLRHALGLDGSPLPGGIALAGSGWAADLLRAAGDIAEQLDTSPEGFAGELRSYQAEALAWLRFLDGAGLGGCLALDMGLGKTPTMLAHLRAGLGAGPALVIAPPAVVGNWAAEARRFTPGIRVVVHHGAKRAEKAELALEVATADVLLTTYGTAVRDIEALADVTWSRLVLDEAQVIKNPVSETAQQLRRLDARSRVALTGTPIENGLGDLWALLDFTNPGLVGDRSTFVTSLSRPPQGPGGSDGPRAGAPPAEQALRTLNGVLVFRRTKAEPAIAAELPDRIDVLDHCPMTPEQIGLYQAVLDDLVAEQAEDEAPRSKGRVLAAITALKQICNHPEAYNSGGGRLAGRSGKLARCEEIVDNAFEAGERVLVFTHFAAWGEQLARHLTERTGLPISCYHGGLSRGARDRMIADFQSGQGAGALVLSLKAGGTGLNLTAANHVVLYDRWWNPAVEDQARDRAWRIGQTKTVVAHRLVVPGTVDERVEEVVAGKRRIADLVLPASSSVDDLHTDQLRAALGIDTDALLTETEETLAQASRRDPAA